MARRRYISTKISTDKQINKLAMEYGDFAVLLYTWMIPHAEDNTEITGDYEELLLTICPGRRDKSVEDIKQAVEGMLELKLIYQTEKDGRPILAFPSQSFYSYQTYIKENRRKTPQNTEEHREVPQNTASLTHSHSHSSKEHTCTVSDVYQDEEIRTQLETISIPINPYWPQFLADCINKGMDRDVVLLAIKRDINKGRRTFTGIEKRLKDWLEKQIFTLEQVKGNDGKVFDIQSKNPRAPDSTHNPPERCMTDDEKRMAQFAAEVEAIKSD